MHERRQYKRYRMPRGTFVILRGDHQRLHDHGKMGIGEIAMVLYKANPEMMSQVVDISIGGVAFKAPAEHVSDTDDLKLDVLMAEQGIYIHDIPFEAVDRQSESQAEHPVNAMRFVDLEAYHKDQLEKLLAHHVE